jgi:hypothetical protein
MWAKTQKAAKGHGGALPLFVSTHGQKAARRFKKMQAAGSDDLFRTGQGLS